MNEPSELQRPLRRRSILVVDDNAQVRRVLFSWLRREGARVVTAASAEAAMRWLERERYDLVITDLDMPGRSGLAWLRTVRESWPRLPLIVVTGTTNRRVVADSAALADAVLAKPVDLPVISRQALELVPD